MALQPPSCSTEGADLTVDFRPLECDIDAVTICPPVSGVFQVEVVNAQGGAEGGSSEVTLESLRANFATYRTNLEGRDLATNATLVQVRDHLDTAETKLQSVIDAVDGVEGALGTTADAEAAAGNGTLVALLKNLRTRISNLETYLDGVEASMTTLNAKDFATQTTLASVWLAVDGLEGAAGAPADVEASSGDGSIVALLKNLRTRLAALESISGGANVEVTQLKVMRGLTDFETRLDYDTRTDGNPVYVGKALNGSATSIGSWVIQRLSYDSSNRLTRAQVLTGQWDGRAALAW